VVETVRDFSGHWTGTGEIVNAGAGDTEAVELEAGEYMISEVVETDSTTVLIQINKYTAGDVVDVDYRHGDTEAACEAAAWNDYGGGFASLGFVQIRIMSTL
jgi:hypothetical protein